jgi:Tfp pilus assembly protein PilF
MPEISFAADTLAWAYYHKGAYGLAIDTLEEALKKSPRSAIYHYHLGMAYAKAGKPEPARQHLEKALQLDPKLPKAQEIRVTLAQLK